MVAANGFVFEGTPWCNGTVDVNVKALTTAITWLASKLRDESQAREELEVRVTTLSNGTHLYPEVVLASGGVHPFVQDHGNGEISNGNTSGEAGDEITTGAPSMERLQAHLRRLEQDLGQHRRQQQQRDVANIEMLGLRVDAMREEMRTYVGPGDLARHSDQLLVHVRDAIAEEAQASARNAVVDLSTKVHARLESTIASLEERLSLFEERIGELELRLGESDQQRGAQQNAIRELLKADAFAEGDAPAASPAAQSVVSSSRPSRNGSSLGDVDFAHAVVGLAHAVSRSSKSSLSVPGSAGAGDGREGQMTWLEQQVELLRGDMAELRQQFSTLPSSETARVLDERASDEALEMASCRSRGLSKDTAISSGSNDTTKSVAEDPLTDGINNVKLSGAKDDATHDDKDGMRSAAQDSEHHGGTQDTLPSPLGAGNETEAGVAVSRRELDGLRSDVGCKIQKLTDEIEALRRLLTDRSPSRPCPSPYSSHNGGLDTLASAGWRAASPHGASTTAGNRLFLSAAAGNSADPSEHGSVAILSACRTPVEDDGRAEMSVAEGQSAQHVETRVDADAEQESVSGTSRIVSKCGEASAVEHQVRRDLWSHLEKLVRDMKGSIETDVRLELGRVDKMFRDMRGSIDKEMKMNLARLQADLRLWVSQQLEDSRQPETHFLASSAEDTRPVSPAPAAPRQIRLREVVANASLEERVRILEMEPARHGDGPPALRAATAAVRERLMQLEKRIGALECREKAPVGARNRVLSPISPRSIVEPDRWESPVDDGAQMDVLKRQIKELQLAVAEGLGGLGEVQISDFWKALRGVQRTADLTSAKLEDLSANQANFKQHVTATLLQNLRSMEDLSHRVGTNVTQRILDGSGETSGTEGAETIQSLVDAKRTFLGDGEVPHPFVSEDALKEFAASLKASVDSRLDKQRHSIINMLQLKADSKDMTILVASLEEASKKREARVHSPAEGFEDDQCFRGSAAVKFPYPEGKCLTCDRAAYVNPSWPPKQW